MAKFDRAMDMRGMDAHAKITELSYVSLNHPYHSIERIFVFIHQRSPLSIYDVNCPYKQDK